MEIKKLLVEKGRNLKEAMRQIDRNGLGIAFIIDKRKRILGVLTDGDIRRAILSGKGLDLPVEKIMGKRPVVAYSSWSDETLKEKLKKKGVFEKFPLQSVIRIPVVDKNKVVKRVIFVSRKGQEKQQTALYSQPSESRAVKRVLVIGGAGYLGSVMVRKLLARGYQVRVLDNLTYGNAGIKELYNRKGFEFVKGDMRDLSAVMNAIKGVDAVIHLAAIVGDPASALSPQNTIEVNYLATKSVAEICKFYQINRFLFASTCSVYGSSKGKALLHENAALNEVSLYAKMKSQSETALIEMRDENFAPTMLRMATLYGISPRMRFDLVVNLLTAKAVFDKKITIFGGSQWRPFLHVEDAAEAFIKCIGLPLRKVGGKVFNVGSNDQNCQIREIGEMVHNVVQDARLVTSKASDKRNYRVSFDKIGKELGFVSRKTVKDGAAEIRQLIEAGKISDYKEKQYSNYRFLCENNRGK